MTMLGFHPMVQEVKETKGTTPSVILYVYLSHAARYDGNHKKPQKDSDWMDHKFNLGDVYVTTTMYKNQCLVRNITGKPPIFIGPLILHSWGTFDVYHQFFSHLSLKLSSLGAGVVFGTDGEASLVRAIVKCFEKPVMLHCSKHFKDNVPRLSKG